MSVYGNAGWELISVIKILNHPFIKVYLKLKKKNGGKFKFWKYIRFTLVCKTLKKYNPNKRNLNFKAHDL